MARIFITGSSDGIGSLTAQALIKRGHEVYLHARNSSRAQDATSKAPGAKECLIADLSSIADTKSLASELNALGPFDSIVHNAGLMSSGKPGKEGIPALFAVNTLAPYILTCLVDPKPKSYVFVSSGLHSGGKADLSGEKLKGCGYGDSKLHDIMLAFAFARRFGGENVKCNAVDPGWVPTKMGGFSAPGNIQGSVDGYVMLALGEGEAKGKTGTFWTQTNQRTPKSSANDEQAQQALLKQLQEISGVNLPE